MAFGINPDMMNALDNPDNNSGDDANKGLENNGTDPNKGDENVDDKNKPDETEKPDSTDDQGKDVVDPEKKDENKDVIEPSEEQVAEFLRKKGGKFEKIEDLLQERQSAPAENPYSSVIENPEVKSFLDFVKETGRGFADYQKLQENINEIPVNDLAIALAKKNLGDDTLDREDLVTYIEEKIGVDIDGLDELTALEKAKLNEFVRDYRNSLLAEQEKYKTPLAKEDPGNEGVEMITLENGQKVEKAIYEDHMKKHQAYQKDMQVAVDSVAPTSLSVEFDNNGTKETLRFDYEYDADDKKNMISLSADIDQTAARLFNTEKGFNHEAFAKAVWRLDQKNWEKEVSAIVNKAIADTTLRLQENENNINLNRNRLPNNGNSSKQSDIFQEQTGFGMKFTY
jgi:hypothetical protein